MKKKFFAAIVLMVMMLSLTACPAETTRVSDMGSNNSVSFEAEGTTSDNDASTEEKSLFASANGGQKLVYTGNAAIGTDSIKKTYKKVTEKMRECDAFFESVDEGSNYKAMTIRIPNKNFMKFYESLSEMDGTVTSSNVNIQDKTKTYTDNERRIEILQAEYKELKELMEKAKTVEEVLSIRQRMSDVTYELESLREINATIDYDTDYGTLYLTLNLNGSHDEASFWHQIKEAFSGGVHLLKQFVLAAIYIWWAILIVIYILYASSKKLWPFKKKEKTDSAVVKTDAKKTKKKTSDKKEISEVKDNEASVCSGHSRTT